MKRIAYHRYGGPEVMALEDFEPSAPGPDEIAVRVKAASINPADWKLRGGMLKWIMRAPFPRGMGSDFAGVVESVGSGVTQFKPGDEVLGSIAMSGGSFAEAAVTKAASAVSKPLGLSFELAAALPAVGVTAWNALVGKGGLRAGSSVFVNGALGGVGQAAVYLAKAMGATVTGRVGPSSMAQAEAIGVSPALDYSQPVPASLNGKFDIVFDTNGSLTPAEGNALLKPKGVLIDINPSGAKLLRTIGSKRRKFISFKPNPEALTKLAELAAAGKLPIEIGGSARLEDGIALISDLEAGRRPHGKAVITIG